jgi:hypothetical protein
VRLVGPWIDKGGRLFISDRWAGCHTYACSTCGPAKIRKLRARIFNGNLREFVKEGREEFSEKFLTLTYPGGDRRSRTSPDQARREMASSFHKLIRALKKRLGPFHHLKVFEPHKDGMPHLHVLLVGDAIRPKEILTMIEDLWRFTYGMGFVNLKKTDGLVHAVRYITKYMTKCADKLAGQFWSASRGALDRVWKVAKAGLATFVSWDSQSTETKIELDNDEAFGFADRLEARKWPKLVDRALEGLLQYFDTQKAIAEAGL